LGNAGGEYQTPYGRWQQSQCVKVDEQDGRNGEGGEDGRYKEKRQRWIAPFADEVPVACIKAETMMRIAAMRLMGRIV